MREIFYYGGCAVIIAASAMACLGVIIFGWYSIKWSVRRVFKTEVSAVEIAHKVTTY